MSLFKYEHKLKYQDLWRYKDEQLTLSFCLSEFIDNSISSCEQQIWNSNPNYKLVINIQYNSQKKQYIIEDNAGGMLPKELSVAMTIGKQNYDYDNSKKNQYGIGMKSAIFWIGKDAIIYSKHANFDEIYGDYHASEKNSNDDVVHDVFKTENQNEINFKTGTKIVINNVYSNNRTITKDQFEKIDYFLGHRYSKYLSSQINQLEINIKFDDIKDEYNNKIQTWDIYRDGVYEFKIDTSKLSKDELENKVNNSMDAINGNQVLINDIKYKLINGLPLEFDDFIDINKDGNEYKTKIKVYILKKASKELAGLGIIQSNRYIYHPVLMKKEDKLGGGLYRPWGDRLSSEEHWRWIRIDLALEDIPGNERCNLVKPEKNKKEIIFDSNSNFSFADFNFALVKKFKEWTKLTNIVRELSQTNKNDDTVKFKNKDAGVSYDEENDILSTEEIIFLNNLEQKIKTKIKILDKPDENWLINLVNHNEDDNLYEYEYNSGNKYFSKIKKESELSYVLKLIIYLDIFYLGKNDDESFAKNIESILNFFQKN